MGVEIARWMIALGTVAAAVGLTVLGMGMSFVRPDDGLIYLGIGLMIGGAAVAIVGGVAHRAADETDRSSR